MFRISPLREFMLFLASTPSSYSMAICVFFLYENLSKIKYSKSYFEGNTLFVLALAMKTKQNKKIKGFIFFQKRTNMIIQFKRAVSPRKF